MTGDVCASCGCAEGEPHTGACARPEGAGAAVREVVDDLVRPRALPERLLRFFDSDLAPGKARGIAEHFRSSAYFLAEALPRTPERTVALRKLLEARDEACRAATQ